MDIQLPIMDGYTATRKIKADPAMQSIPIIAVTSYALSGEEKMVCGFLLSLSWLSVLPAIAASPGSTKSQRRQILRRAA
jgi:CheY-like chemotaxis protein